MRIRVTFFAVLGAMLLASSISAQVLLTDPTIAGFSSEFPTYESTFALDENQDTDWASNGDGVNTYMDFNFGAQTRITQVNYTDRRTSGGANGTANLGVGDNVTSFNLIFSTDAVFGNGDDVTQAVVSGPCCVTDTVIVNLGAGYLAQYVRFDVTGTDGPNPGAAEFDFFTDYADLSITKTAAATVNAGQNITYTITVTNNGPTTASAVQVLDTIPAGTTFVSATPSQGSCAAGPPVDCDLGTILNAGNATITLIVTAPVTAGDVSNTATVSNTPEPDDDATNDTSTPATTVTVIAIADLSITKTGPPTVSPGGQISYTITVMNNGPSAATNVQVLDTIPPTTTYVSATPSQGTCAQGPPVDCDLGGILSGNSATITLIVTAPATPGLVTNSATVSVTPETDNDSSDNTSSPATTIVGAGGGGAALPAEIPTASTWALMALAAALMGIVLLKLR